MLRHYPANPHYFEFRGKPAVLIGSGEHYGAVHNLAFDYKRYLPVLADAGLNLTRLFAGPYREIPGSFGITDNTLAPTPNNFVCPWFKIADAAAGRFERYDLSRWDEAFFARLADFLKEADRHNVVVEVVPFCFLYNEELWAASPLHPTNNLAGTGPEKAGDVYAMKDEHTVQVMEAMLRRIVRTIAPFDNVYLELMNEPYSTNDSKLFEPFHHRMAKVAADELRTLNRPLLIAYNIANAAGRADALDGGLPPQVGILNIHYARPAAVAWNYHRNLPIMNDETGFSGQQPDPYRREAWNFMLSGGAGISNLDYSFTAAHPDGTAPVTGETPGSGGPEIRRQLRALKDFCERIEIWNLRPMPEVANPMAMRGHDVAVMGDPGRLYVAYLDDARGNPIRVGLLIPRGHYQAEWITPATGSTLKKLTFDFNGGWGWWTDVPPFRGDCALIVRRTVQ